MRGTAKKREINMLEGSLTKSITFYTIPIILTGILQLLFNAADLIVVGQFCGEISVAAVGNTGSITALIVNLFMGLSVGTGVSVAQGIGANDERAVKKAVHTALPVAIISGLIITVVGITCSEKVLQLMNTPDTVLPLSDLYMKIYFAGTIFIMVYNFCAAILRAAGDTKSPSIFPIIAGIINVILNLIFVVFLDMNVAGVALATTISQAISAVLVVVELMKRTDACKLVLSKLRIYKRPLMHIIAIGLPAGIQSSLFAISNTIIQSSINSFGDVVMSGNAAAGNVEGFIYVIVNAFHQTVINFVGQNVGAMKYERVKKIYVVCLELVMVTSLAAGFIIYSFGEFILSAYIPESPEAVMWGMVRLSSLCIPFFLCGMMEISTGALRGMGVSVAPMLISVLGICGIRILWIYTIFQIPEYHTVECLYFSYIVSWIVTFLAQTVVFCIEYKRNTRVN